MTAEAATKAQQMPVAVTIAGATAHPPTLICRLAPSKPRCICTALRQAAIAGSSARCPVGKEQCKEVRRAGHQRIFESVRSLHVPLAVSLE